MTRHFWTPTVAVTALIWKEEHILFLHRVHPPRIWVPPGGRVEAHETPEDALRREVREETGIQNLDIVGPCIVEAGLHNGKDILFIDYVCRADVGEIVIDPYEHDGWRWIAWSAIQRAHVKEHTAPGGEVYFAYRWLDDNDSNEESLLSHSPSWLERSRRLLRCLRPDVH